MTAVTLVPSMLRNWRQSKLLCNKWALLGISAKLTWLFRLNSSHSSELWEK